jgi:hypothetical protein
MKHSSSSSSTCHNQRSYFPNIVDAKLNGARQEESVASRQIVFGTAYLPNVNENGHHNIYDKYPANIEAFGVLKYYPNSYSYVCTGPNLHRLSNYELINLQTVVTVLTV